MFVRQIALLCYPQSRITKTVLLMLLCCAASFSLAQESEPPAIMIVGDSISAAYGLKREEGWVALLDQHLDEAVPDKNYQVINASISGETTSGGLARLPKLLQQNQPSIVIIELGGNDGLRGHSINSMRSNLDKMAELSLAANAKVLIAGMRIPPNYGKRYTDMFYDSFQLTAEKYQLPLIPFLLDEIAIYPEMMQRDGMHPTAAGQPRILQNVLTQLSSLL